MTCRACSLLCLLLLAGCASCGPLVQIDPNTPPPAPADQSREVPTLLFFGLTCRF